MKQDMRWHDHFTINIYWLGLNIGSGIITPILLPYLGISNLAGAGAGIVGAGIGGPMADFFNALRPGLGYLVIFALYAALFVLSSVALTQVKVQTQL